MPRTYTVRLLDETEWKRVVEADPRYRGVDESNAGFADPQTGKAFVRQEVARAWPGAKQYLLQHEFEHLVSDEPWHEDRHGIRHKRGFLRNLAAITAAPFTGGMSLLSGSAQQHPVLGRPGGTLNRIGNTVAGAAPYIGGALGGFGGPGGAAAGAGLGSVLKNLAQGQSISGRQAALSAGIAGLGQGLTGGLSGQSFAPPTGSPSRGLLSLPGPGGASATGPASLTTPPGGSTVSPRLTSGGLGAGGRSLAHFGVPPLTSSSLGLQRGLYSGGGGPPPPPPPPPPTGGGFLSQFFRRRTPGAIGSGIASGIGSGLGSSWGSMLQKNASTIVPAALGAGIAQYGQTAGPPRPDMPELSQLPGVQQFRTDVNAQLNPLMARLQGLSTTPLPSTLESPIRRQFENQRRQLYGQFAAFRPGADLATDTDYRRAAADLSQREAESISQAQLAFQGNERENIMAQLGISDEELGHFGSLAQLDIDTIMARTGLQAQDAAQFKEVFGNLGGLVAGAGLLNAFRVP